MIRMMGDDEDDDGFGGGDEDYNCRWSDNRSVLCLAQVVRKDDVSQW